MFHGINLTVFHGVNLEPKWRTEIEPNQRTEPNRTESPLKGADSGSSEFRFSPISVRFAGAVDKSEAERRK